MMRTFQLLHLELLRLELLGSAVSPSAGPAIAGQPPASSAEDQDVGAQASRIEHRRLTTLPSGRRAYQSRKLCSPLEIARAPSDPTSSRFSRAPSVSTRASAMCSTRCTQLCATTSKHPQVQAPRTKGHWAHLLTSTFDLHGPLTQSTDQNKRERERMFIMTATNRGK